MGKTSFFISNIEVRKARRFFVKILLFTPVLLLVLAVNIGIDPSGLYRKMLDKNDRYEYHIAQAMAAGRNVKIDREVDDRLVQKYFIENLTVAPDIVILGSSRTTWLGGNIFPNDKVINNSVIRAELPDYLGIFEGYIKKNFCPRRVFFLLDPQLIVYPLTYQKWVSIKEDTYGMLGRLGVGPGKFKQSFDSPAWLNILSFSYFQQSIMELQDNHRQQTLLGNNGRSFLKDGRYMWMDHLAWVMKKRRRGVIRQLYRKHREKLLSQGKPDKELEDILEDFIRYLTGHQIRVTLCLLPLHPLLYKSFIGPPKEPGEFDLAGVEHYYRGLAQKLGLEIIGSYDPADCNLNDSDFYDVDHMSNGALERILKQKGTKCSMPASQP